MKPMWYGNVQETLTIAHCSFCGKSQDQVTPLTPGPGHLFICHECVDFCRDMVEQGHPLSQWREWQTELAEPTAITGSIHPAYEAIRRAVLDYVEGIEEGDPTRIERSVHPDLQTRGFLAVKEGSSSLITLTFPELLEMKKNSQKDGKMPKDMIIYDLGDQIATVKLTAWRGTDYLHVAKEQDQWMIVNILRHMHAQDNNWLDNPHEQR